MLKATFQCFQGIGGNSEQRLWESGCLCWQDFREASGSRLSASRKNVMFEQLKEAERSLETGSAAWFLERLRGASVLRVLYEFFADALFLDIETTGLDPFAKVTSIATWKNGQVKCFIRDINLADFLYELPGTSLLVTYNGKHFDLPFLRREFDSEMRIPHLDLMYPLRAMGHRGGLKNCEKRLGFQRRYSEGADGLEAVRLWRAWSVYNCEESLNRLIIYNIEDTYSLAWLTARAMREAMAGYPEEISMTEPPPPDINGALAEVRIGAC